MRRYEIQPHLKEILRKIQKRDASRYERILLKIEEIINSENIEHYKNLRHGMKDLKRVQIRHFVLVFKFIKSENRLLFVDFDHHDNVYKKI